MRSTAASQLAAPLNSKYRTAAMNRARRVLYAGRFNSSVFWTLHPWRDLPWCLAFGLTPFRNGAKEAAAREHPGVRLKARHLLPPRTTASSWRGCDFGKQGYVATLSAGVLGTAAGAHEGEPNFRE